MPVEDDTGAVQAGNGTSGAAAYVSAVVALLHAVHPTWTAGQIIRDLIATAHLGPGMSAGAHSDEYGYGIVDPLAALQAPAPAKTTNPLVGSSPQAIVSTSPATAAQPTSVVAKPAPPSSFSGLIVGVVAGIVVLCLVVVGVLAARRNRRPPPGPGVGSPGQHGPPGYSAYPYQPSAPQPQPQWQPPPQRPGPSTGQPQPPGSPKGF